MKEEILLELVKSGRVDLVDVICINLACELIKAILKFCNKLIKGICKSLRKFWNKLKIDGAINITFGKKDE